jgi:hypothetical protein
MRLWTPTIPVLPHIWCGKGGWKCLRCGSICIGNPFDWLKIHGRCV